MDTDNQNLNENSPTNLTLSAKAAEYLLKTAPWIKFLCILGIAYFGIIIIMLLISIAMGVEQIIPTIFIFAIMAIVAYFPLYFLFKYSIYLTNACKTNDSDTLENAFNMQKKFWKFYGIFSIISIGFFIVALIIGLILGGTFLNQYSTPSI